MNSRSRLRWVPVALSLLAFEGARAAHAEAGARPAPVVRLYVAAAEPVMAALVERLQPRLGAMGVALAASVIPSVDIDAVLATAPGANDRAPLAQVWLDGRTSSDATLFLLPRRADRVLARRIPFGATFDEVALAEVVFVIERAVSSLLASRPVGVPKTDLDPSLRRRTEPPPAVAGPGAEPPPAVAGPGAEPPPSRSAEPPPAAAPSDAEPSAVAGPPLAESPPLFAEAPPVAEPAVVAAPPADAARAPRPPPDATPVVESAATTPAPRAFASFQLGAFAGAESWATGHAFVPDVGLVAIAERVRDRARWGVSLDGQLRGGIEADTSDGKIDLSGGGAHLLFSVGRSFGRAIGRLAAGPGIAVSEARATPSSAVASATARPRTDLDGTLAVMLRWDFPLSGRLRAFIAAGADAALATGRYTAVVDGTSTALLTAWPVRPTLRIGFAVGAR